MSEQYPPYPPQGPGPAPFQQAGPPPPNNLVLAILSLVLCCLPTGIAAVVFASQVNSKWAQGDQAGALASAQKAKTWSIVGIVVGAVGGILYGLLVGMGAASGSWSSYGG